MEIKCESCQSYQPFIDICEKCSKYICRWCCTKKLGMPLCINNCASSECEICYSCDIPSFKSGMSCCHSCGEVFCTFCIRGASCHTCSYY